LPTLPHRTPRALCGSVEKNTDSLVKGMILFDQGGGRGEGRGEKVMVESAPPCQSVVRLFPLVFFVVCARDCEDFILILSRAQKYWRETHLLVPLPSGIGQLLTLYCPGGRQVLGCAVRFFSSVPA
jgi:hypothetical protein